MHNLAERQSFDDYIWWCFSHDSKSSIGNIYSFEISDFLFWHALVAKCNLEQFFEYGRGGGGA